MRLFGGKSRFEEAANGLQKDLDALFGTLGLQRENFADLFASPEGINAFFGQWFPMVEAQGKEILSELRKASNQDYADLMLTRYENLLDRVYTGIYVEAVSRNMVRTRQFILDTLDAFSTHNDQRLAALREEMKSVALTPEQKEVIDSLLDAFRKWGMGTGPSKG